MAYPRHLTVDNDSVGIYHCFSRCVRQSFLCGVDPLTGRDFSHRKRWIENRLRFLSQKVFCVETLALSVMDNHYHCVIRNRPDCADELTPLEVAIRWNRIHPINKGPVVPNDPAATKRLRIETLAGDDKEIKRIRALLHNVSKFNACLNEFIARRANREDEASGRFWQGRFGCQRIFDIGALLTVMSYVDLNPVRAALAENLEDCHHTSIKLRLQAEEARKKLQALPPIPNPTPAQRAEVLRAKSDSLRDDWLVPFGVEGSPLQEMTIEDYLGLLQIAGRKGNKGFLSPDQVELLERFDLNAQVWVENVNSLGGLFYQMIGKAEHLKIRAREKGMAWFCGKRGANALYRS
jgi:hypothetical protein